MLKAGHKRLVIKDIEDVKEEKKDTWSSPTDFTAVQKAVIPFGQYSGVTVWFTKGCPLKIGDNLHVIRLGEVIAYEGSGSSQNVIIDFDI